MNANPGWLALLADHLYWLEDGSTATSPALGLGRTKAYELARSDHFPCRVLRIGDTYRIPTAGLLELLGVSPEPPARN